MADGLPVADKLRRQELSNKVGIGFDLPTLTGDPQPKSIKTLKHRKRKSQPSLTLPDSDVVTMSSYVSTNDDLPEIFFDPVVPTAEVL
jgi:hypothetical protein